MWGCCARANSIRAKVAVFERFSCLRGGFFLVTLTLVWRLSSKYWFNLSSFFAVGCSRRLVFFCNFRSSRNRRSIGSERSVLHAVVVYRDGDGVRRSRLVFVITIITINEVCIFF